MKTKNFFLIALFAIIAIIGLTGCEWIRDIFDDPVVTKYTIEALVVGTGGTITSSVEVVSGENSTVNFNPDVGYDIDVVKVDGVVVPTDSSYTFKDVTSNHKIEVTYKKNTQGLLMQPPLGWETVSCYQRDVGTTEWKIYGTHIFTYIFSETRANVFLDGKLIGDSKYTIKGDSLIMGGIRTKIINLTETSLEFSFISKYYQGPGDPILPDSEIRYIYKPKK